MQGLAYAVLLSATVAVIRIVFTVATERTVAYGLWVDESSAGVDGARPVGSTDRARPGRGHQWA